MPRARRHPPLNVFLNSRLVGQLRRQSSGAIEFQYDRIWLDWEHTLPVSLSLPLREDRYVGAPVIAVFDNLLPDNDAIRRRMTERVRAQGADAYSLLSAVGRDCVGALQFLPDGEEPVAAGAIKGTRITSQEIADILANLGAAPLGLGEDEDFRISIAGAQEKTALLFWKKHWHKPVGTSATTHIFKPQIGRLPNGLDLSYSVENEYLCLKVLAAFGIPSAEAVIAEFEGKRVLVIERFDRLWTRDKRLLRLPQEDMCQALSVPPSLKYEADGGPGIVQILDLLRASDTPEEDRRLFLKTNILFWLLGATDGHAKNFSIFLSPGGRFRLTPVYDVISAQPSVDAGHIRRNRMKLAMAVGEHRHYTVHSVVPRHFIQSAALAGIGRGVIESLFADVLELAPAAIERVTNSLPATFPQEITASIIGGFQSRLETLGE